ncbi:hypothetical protein R1flu_019271 [Riccia fluitans]|uniref:Uncharacterized protein n=1 Tax=Riccia fluitans TaxID=41844 RepID=A0ABD1ZI79_9MARC
MAKEARGSVAASEGGGRMQLPFSFFFYISQRTQQRRRRRRADDGSKWKEETEEEEPRRQAIRSDGPNKRESRRREKNNTMPLRQRTGGADKSDAQTAKAVLRLRVGSGCWGAELCRITLISLAALRSQMLTECARTSSVFEKLDMVKQESRLLSSVRFERVYAPGA